MAFSNVKHKRQSCRTCRTSVTQTFVSLYGFSVMFPPPGEERFWTLSFVTVFSFFFFRCVSTFLILDSGCIVFDVHCTFTKMHCVLCIALFSVMSGLSPLGQLHHSADFPLFPAKHTQILTVSALRLSKIISQLQTDVNTLLMCNTGYELGIEASVLVGHGAPFTALQIVFTG